MAFVLRYLFYAGIIVPTVVTLALFIFFVVCWRKQSVRKQVLTKPYDPHGTMRRLGIPNRPPAPPMFLRDTMPTSYGTAGPTSPLEDNYGGGEDNAAYDMSRSPSAEASTGGQHQQHHQTQQTNNLSTMTAAGLHNLRLHFDGSAVVDGAARIVLDQGTQLMQFSPSADSHSAHRAAPALPVGSRGPLQFSPSREFNQGSGHQLAYHNRLDSGLFDPACESPGAASSRSSQSTNSASAGSACSSSSGGGQNGGFSGSGGCGTEGGGTLQDRPQSQASHSSHSTDSEDSGFRSSRSGHILQNSGSAGGRGGFGEPPVLRRSRSAGRSKGRGYYHKAATSSPDSEPEAGIQLTPSALWPHHYNHQPVPTSSPTHHLFKHPSCDPQPFTHHYPQHPHHTHNARINGDMCVVKTSALELKSAPHLEWKYLPDHASPPAVGQRGKGPSPGVHKEQPMLQQQQHLHEQSQTMTCHQITMAQVHTPRDLDSPDAFGFSVV